MIPAEITAQITAAGDAPTFHVAAYANSVWGTREVLWDSPKHLRATAYYATAEDAAQAAASMPKSIKALSSTLTGYDNGESWTVGIVTVNARLSADGVNGGRNEAGIRRYRALAKNFALVFVTGDAVGSYTDQATFETAIAG
jgi:hypothetical protein